MDLDPSLPMSLSEKAAEYDINQRILDKERNMNKMESRRRRKVPKPGCYPAGFSEYTMGSVPCTLSLSELRVDLSKCVPQNLSVYFEEAMPAESRSAQTRPTKHARPPAELPTERFSLRRKTPTGHILCPRSAAEEARQLSEVLRKSLAECGGGRPAHCDTEPTPCLGDAFEAHRRSTFAANVLCGLN